MYEEYKSGLDRFIDWAFRIILASVLLFTLSMIGGLVIAGVLEVITRLLA